MPREMADDSSCTFIYIIIHVHLKLNTCSGSKCVDVSSTCRVPAWQLWLCQSVVVSHDDTACTLWRTAGWAWGILEDIQYSLMKVPVETLKCQTIVSRLVCTQLQWMLAYVCVCMCMCVYMYSCMYSMCVDVCMCIYIYIYIIYICMCAWRCVLAGDSV